MRCGWSHRSSRATRGFTLVEIMVALVVIATVAATVYSRSGETISQLYSLERRTLARWVAENEIERVRLARLSTDAPLPTGTTRSRVVLGERQWMVVARTQPTSHPWLRRVDFTVFAIVDDRDVGPIDTVTAFVGRY